MSRASVLTLYALLVLIWSSTWVAIKIGLEDCPALLGAGIRFARAGLVLLAVAAVQRRPLRTDWLLAGVLALAPFAFAYGLVYWGEQYVPSGLAAVLFGVLPLYTALLAGVLLPDEPLRAPLLVGVLIGIGGLALAFLESVELGLGGKAALGAAALALAPLGAAVGGVAQKRRAGELDAVVLNGWAMLVGGLLLLPASALERGLGRRCLERRVGRLDRLPGAVRLGRRVRDADGAAAPHQRAGDVVPGDAASVRRARVRRDALRRADHGTCAGGAALVAAGLLIAQRSRRHAQRVRRPAHRRARPRRRLDNSLSSFYV